MRILLTRIGRTAERVQQRCPLKCTGEIPGDSHESDSRRPLCYARCPFCCAPWGAGEEGLPSVWSRTPPWRSAACRKKGRGPALLSLPCHATGQRLIVWCVPLGSARVWESASTYSNEHCSLLLVPRTWGRTSRTISATEHHHSVVSLPRLVPLAVSTRQPWRVARHLKWQTSARIV